MSYRNKQSTNDVRKEKFVRYSIRKLGNYGAASVAVAAGFFFLGGGTAQASEIQEAAIVHQAQSSETPEKQGDTASVQPEAEATATPVNKEALTQLVSELKGLDVTTKTEQSLVVFQASLTQAETLLTQETATQEQVDQAKQDLEAAHNQLVEKEVKQEEGSEEGKKEVATPPAAVAPTTPAETDKKLVTKSFSVKPATKEEIEATRNPQKPTETPALEAGSGFRDTPESETLAGFEVKFRAGHTTTGAYINPSDIINAGDGQNIQLTMEVQTGVDVTDRQLVLTLGPFLDIVDNPATQGNDGLGMTNETVQAYVSNATVRPITKYLTGADGQRYLNGNGAPVNYASERQVVYTFKKDGTVQIPLTLKVDTQAHILGMTTTGDLSGSKNKIEKATPLQAHLSGTYNGDTKRSVAKVDQLQFSPQTSATEGTLSGSFSNFGISPEFANANNRNGYLVDARIHNYHSLQGTGSGLFFEAGTTVDMILPKGVSFHSFPDGYALKSPFIKTNEVTAPGTGITTVTLTADKNIYSRSQDSIFRLKVDPAIVKERFVVNLRNWKPKLRNYEQPPGGITYGGITLFVAEYGEENIGLFRSDYPGTIDFTTTLTTSDPLQLDGQYVPIGQYGRFIQNFDDKETERLKEVRIAFPENDKVDVTGFRLPLINNNAPVNTIKVRSKKNPDQLVEVQLPKTYTNSRYEHIITLRDLKLDEDDSLLEVVVPIGKIPANYQGTDFFGSHYATNVVGRVKTGSAFSNQTIASYTVRDQDFSADNPERNRTTKEANVKLQYAPDSLEDRLAVTIPQSSEISYGNSSTLSYRVDVQDATRNAGNTFNIYQVKNVYLTLPTDVTVKNIRVRNGNTYITNIDKTDETRDGKTIYKLNFQNVTGLDSFIGRVGDYQDSSFTERRLTVEVDVENEVSETKAVSLNQTLFVETVAASGKTVSSSVSKIDPYNLATNDSALFTNIDATNVLTLSKRDQLDLKAQAGLQGQPLTSANTTFNVTDIGTALNLEYKIINPSSNPAGGIDMFIPVPKQGQNWGTRFQQKAFDYGLSLTGNPVKDAQFDTLFEVSYATVDPSKLNGSQAHNANTLAGESFNPSPSDWNTINLIRIQSKSNQVLPPNSENTLNLKLRLDNVDDKQDGSTIAWKPHYKASFNGAVSFEESRTTTMQIALGKLAVRVFEDKDVSGSKGAEETTLIPDVKIEVLDEKGDVVATKNTVGQDTLHFDSLVSDKYYTIRATTPNLDTYHFTTGTVARNKVTSSHTKKAELRPESQVTVTEIGLTQKKTTLNFVTDTTTGSLATATATGFYDDTIVAPSVTANAGYEFIGWTNADGLFFTPAELAKVTYGKADDVTYTAQYVKHLKTVYANSITWNGGSEVPATLTLNLKKNADTINTVILDKTKAGHSWTGLSLGNYVVDGETTPRSFSVIVTPDATTPHALPTDAAALKAFWLSATKEEGTGAALFNKETSLSAVNVNYTVPKQTITADIKWGIAPNVKPTIQLQLKRNGQNEGAAKEVPNGTTQSIWADVPVTDDQGRVYNYTVEQTPLTGYDTNITPLVQNKVTVLNNYTDAHGDTDGDGIVNIDELNGTQNTKFQNAPTDPTKADSDNDGVNDKVELEAGSDPNDPNSRPAQSQQPVVDPIDTNDLKITGTASPEAKIEITLPTGKQTRTADSEGKWELTLDAPLQNGQEVTVVETAKESADGIKALPSTPVVQTVRATAASTATVNAPVITVVDNVNKLSPDDMEKVKNAIHDANPSIPKENISVDEKGKATIRYEADGSVNTLEPSQTIRQRRASAQPTVNPVDSDDKTISGRGEVGATITVTLPNGDTLSKTVEGDGSWSIALPSTLPTNSNLQVTQKVGTNDPSEPVSVSVKATQAETATLTPPTNKVKVDNPAKLSGDEVEKVKNVVSAANPTIDKDKITVSTDGKVTVEYPDGSVKELLATDVVEEKAVSATPTVNPVDSDDRDITGTGGTPGATIKVTVNGQEYSRPVNDNGTWSVPLPAPLQTGTVISVTQQAKDEKVSPPQTVSVKASDAEKAEGAKDGEQTKVTLSGERAIAYIESQPNLTKEEKDALKAQVNSEVTTANNNIGKATTPSDVTEAAETGKEKIEKVVLKASQDDAVKAIEKAVAQATQAIDKQQNLTGEIQQALRERVNTAAVKAKQDITSATKPPLAQTAEDAGIQAINSIVLEGEKENAKKGIEDAGRKATALINAQENLTPQEKSALHQRVEDAATPANNKADQASNATEAQTAEKEGREAIDAIALDAAKKDATNAIDKTATTANEAINAQSSLTSQEQEDLRNRVAAAVTKAKEAINGATTPEEAQTAEDNGKKAIAAINLDASKKDAAKVIDAAVADAKNTIDDRSDLTKEEKDAAKKVIDAKADEAKKAVDAAPTDAVDTAKENGTAAITSAANNTPAEKKPAAVKAIEDAAAAQIAAINGRNDLTDEEKTEAVKAVNAAKDTAKNEINAAPTNAAVADKETKGKEAIKAPVTAEKKPAAIKAVEDAAEEKKAEIDGRSDLTNEDKKAAKDAVDTAVANATKAINAGSTNEAVDNAKDAGLTAINTPIDVTTKGEAKKTIDNAAKTAKDAIEARKDLTAEEKNAAKAEIDTKAEKAKKAIDDAKANAEVLKATVDGAVAVNPVVVGKAKPAAKAEIDAKADEAKKAIDARNDLTNEEKAAAKDAIDAKAVEAKKAVDDAEANEAVNTAKTNGTTAITSAKDNTPAEKKPAAKAEIDTKATEAKQAIDARPELTAEEKKAAKDAIDAKAVEAKKAVDEAEANDAVNTAKANGTTAIDKVVTDTTPVAKPAAKAEIDAEAEKAKNAIDARSDLTAEEKKDAKDAIDTAADKAKKAVDAAEANAGVDAAKDDGKAAINTPVAAAAKPAAIKAVEDAAKAKKAEIDKQDSLTDEEKAIAKAGVDQVAADAKTAINNAPTNDAVGNAKDAGLTAIGKTVSATSKPEAKRKVQDAANAATKAIDARNDLTAEEKKDAKDAIAVAAANAAKAIDAATTSPEVLQAAVDGVTAINKPVAGSAKQAAKDAINAAKEAATKAIAANNALTAEEKANAVATIDAETTKALAAVDAAKDKAAVDAAKADGVQAVNTGVTNAQPAVKPAAVTAINAEAEKAKAAIDGRTDLTADEKDAAKKAVEAAAAKAIDAINAAGTNAGVEEAKANGISAINTPVTAAARPAAIKAIEDAAKAKKAEIDGRTDLTADEKDAAKKAVDNAVKDAKDAINAADTNPAVEDAKTNGISAINTPVEATVRPAAIKAVEDAAKAKKAEIDGRNDLTNEDKKAAKDGIDAIAAKAITAINASPTTDAVDEAKKAGISAINTPIDASTKDEAKKSIDNAAKAAKAAIDARGDLTTEEKGTAKAAIETAAGKAKKDVDAAGTNAAVLKATIDGVIAVNPVVVGTAKPTAKAEIDAKATEEKQAIEAHPELTAEEKQAAKEAIDQKADEAKQAIDTAEANADVEDATTAGKAAIEKAGQDALPVVKPAGKTAIDNAAKAAKEAIDARDDLTTEEKKTAKDAVDAKAKEAKAAVDAATTNAGVEAATTAGTKAITSVKDNTQAVAKPAAKAAIDAKATEEKAAIDARGDLTTEEKAAAKDAVDTAADKAKKAVDAAEANADVDAATTAGTKAITSVKDNTQAVAKPAAKAEIDAEAEKAKKAIDARGDLTTEEKATAKDAVDTAADKAKKAVDDAKANADVDTATDAGKAAIEKVVTDATPVAKPAAKAEIDAEAEKAKKAIDARGDLTAEEKKVAKDAVDVKATEAKKAVDKAAANADVEAATTAGKAAINTPVEAATKPAAIKAIEDAAKAKKADIDKQDSLTAEEKAIAKAGVDQVAADAKTAINNAPTDKAVEIAKQAGLEAIAQTVVATSKPEAKQKVQAAAKAATKAIDARNDLTDEEKKAAKDAIAEAAAKADKAIDAATTSPEVLQAAVNGITAINKPVAGSVKQAAKDAINAAKEIATKAIAAKDALTAEEKAKAVAAIEAAAQRALTAIDAAKGNNAVETAKQAGIQEIEAGVTNAQPAAKPAAVAAINAEADKVKAAIEKRTDLTDDEKDAAKKAVEAAAAKAIDAINAAGTNAGVETAKANGIVEINKPVVSSVKPNALAAIDAEAEKATQAIDARNDLTAEEKAAAKKAIKAAKDAAKKAINEATSDASVAEKETQGKAAINTPVEATVRPAAIKAVEDAAKAKKDAIDARSDLTNEDKKAAKDGIDAIVAKAVAAINASPTNDAVKAAKDAGIAAINTPIDATTKEAAKKTVTDAAQAAKNAIKGRSDLTTEEKDEAVALIDTETTNATDAIEAAGTNADVLKETIDGVIAVNPVVVGEVKPTAKDAIDAAADKAKKAIDARDDLTAEEKAAAKDTVDTKADEAKKAVDAAEANADVDAAKDLGLAAIDKAVTDATPVAKPAAKAAIDAKAKEEKAAIDARNDLTAEEKAAAKDQIEAAATAAKDAVDAATTDASVDAAKDAGLAAITAVKDNTQAVAKPTAQAAIDAKADEAKKAIDARGDLTTEEKAAAKAEIDAEAEKAKKAVDDAEANADVEDATTAGLAAIDKVVTDATPDAKPAAKAEIDAKAKEEKAAIDARGDLTTEEKATAKDAVDTAADKAKKAVDDAEANADVEDATTAGKAAIEKAGQDAFPVVKPAAKAEIDAEAEKAKKAIDARGDLTTEEKATAKDAVDTAADKAKKAVDAAEANADVDAAKDAGLAAIEKAGQAALPVVKPAGKTAIDNAAKAAKEAIDARGDLTAEEKKTAKDAVDTAADKAKKAVDAATTNAGVEAATTAGKAAIEKAGQAALPVVKPAAKAEIDAKAKEEKAAIDARSDLTAEEKKAAKDAIDTAADKAKKAVDAATTNAGVAAAKDAGKAAIDKVAKDAKPVAKDAAKDAIDAAADEAKKAIDARSDLTDEEKKAAKDAIDAAADKAKKAVDAATTNAGVSTAVEQGKATLDVIVKDAVKQAEKAAQQKQTGQKGKALPTTGEAPSSILGLALAGLFASAAILVKKRKEEE